MATKLMRLPALLLIPLLTACVDSGGREQAASASVESCMLCHNGSNRTDYAGPGIQNPHPFGAPGSFSANMTCTECHGGNPNGQDKNESHVPPPPQIGDRAYQTQNNYAYFNRLTMTGIDKLPDYTVNGQTYSAIDFLQFINPGDLRVVQQGRSCGRCHMNHVETVSRSPLATSTGVLSGALAAAGLENAVPASRGLHQDTATDYGFRAVSDPDFDAGIFGTVPELWEYPVYSDRNDNGPMAVRANNPLYDSANIDANAANYFDALGRAIAGQPIANLYTEQVAFTCGDCHLGSAGANNRTGDYRSSGCTTCHMPYSQNGRSYSRDPNIPRDEPYDPDNINDPEQPHVRQHVIVSTYRPGVGGGPSQQGIDDYACAGCHQGSNRTVMQYWGIRLDQNQDLRRGVQYPAQPASFLRSFNDARLFGFEGRPDRVTNREFNGRNGNQYILEEDYDGDGRDDTPPDVHYDAGMGCIDCHGSVDLHGGNVNDPNVNIKSHQEHAVAIQCENCHGSASAYAAVVSGLDFNRQQAQIGVDTRGNPLNHVIREADGHTYLYSKLTGKKHFIPQTRDTVVDSGVTNPFTSAPVYSAKASYAMGRDDGDPTTGIGPTQGGAATNFSHGDNMDCASCHASWTNTCMGCHLIGEIGNDFSNITGARIDFEERNAEFVYQSPVYFQLGVNARGKITQMSSNTKVFFRWEDRNNVFTRVFTFTDRKGNGSNPNHPYPAMGHNALMAHSIRGKVSSTKEGPRYCSACHLTQDGLTQYGTEYTSFRTIMASNQYDQLNFTTLTQHFGLNPNNQMNSPLWVHGVAGLGTGLFLFDENGCPVNPLDQDDNRFGCENVSPFDRFDITQMLARVKFNLDKIVDGATGQTFAASNHALISGTPSPLRDGQTDPLMAGPLGVTLVDRLTNPTTGIILVNYLDADGIARGGLGPILNPPAPQTTGK